MNGMNMSGMNMNGMNMNGMNMNGMNMNMNNMNNMNMNNMNMNNMNMNNMNNMFMNMMNNMFMNMMMNNMNQGYNMNNINNMNNNMGNMNLMNNFQMPNNMPQNMMLNNNMNQQNFINMNNNNQKINQMMGQNGFNINSGQMNVGGNAPPEIIPRLNKTMSEDFFKNDNNRGKINVVLNASSGLAVVLPSPPNITVKKLIRNYLKKLGLREGVLNGGIIFIYNAEVVNVNDERPLSSFFRDQAVIIVVDVQGVIAA